MVVLGLILLGLAGLVLLFMLPDAAQQRQQKRRASAQAKRTLEFESEKLNALERTDRKVTENRKRVASFLDSIPDQSIGALQWELSQRLHGLALAHGVRLQSLKYGSATKEGTKGTDLEVLAVEFTVIGIYQNLKPFMLGLEDPHVGQIHFAVANAKLEESPDGARLNVILRAFRRTGTRTVPRSGEGS